MELWLRRRSGDHAWRARNSSFARNSVATHLKLPAAALAAFLLGMPILGACQAVGIKAEYAVPSTPAPVKGIVAARRFSLQTPYTNTWSAEGASVSSGVLVVLEVDPAYVVPRDALQPMLYAGNVLVQRLNHGHLSGRVIGIVPGNIDLAAAPIWFGAPELPERVTRAMVESERARAEKAGVRAFPQARIAGVEGPAVAAKDLAALLRTVGAELVYQFSPQEKELADAWRLPVAKVPPKKKV